MAITYPDSSTLTYLTGADSFRNWMNTTNNLIYTLSANTVTVGGNAIGTFTIGNSSHTATSLLICNKVFANLSVFNVSSIASFGANVTVNALASDFRVSTSVNTILQSASSTVINSPSLLVTANTTIQGGTTLSGNVEFNGTNKQVLIGGGTAGILAGLKVTSDAEFANAFFTKATFNQLSLSGALTLPSLAVTGTETVGTTLTVGGDTTLNSGLTVSGAANLANTLKVTGAANTLSTLGVSGAANVMNALGVAGKLTISSNNSIPPTEYALNVETGNTYFGGRMTVASLATLSGALNVTGATTLSTTLSVGGAATLSSSASVAGALTVTGVTTLNGGLNSPSGTSALNALSVTNGVTIGTTLGVTGATSIAALAATTGNFSGTVTAPTFNGTTGVFSGTVTGGSFSGVGTSLTALNASNLASGTVPTARLATGTANSTTFLRGDGQWATTDTSAWITLSLSGDWVAAYGTTEFPAPAYRYNPLTKEVVFRGLVKSTSGNYTVTYPIAILPSGQGLRPDYTVIMNQPSYQGHVDLRVKSDGYLFVQEGYNGANVTQWVSLDGLRIQIT